MRFSPLSNDVIQSEVMIAGQTATVPIFCCDGTTTQTVIEAHTSQTALERGKAPFSGFPGPFLSGGPRNRTWRCGFGDRRVTDTPVPRAARDCRPLSASGAKG